MIRSTYTNKTLLGISKYRKFLILRTYNALVVITLYIFTVANAIEIANTHPLIGLIYLLSLSFAIYFLVTVHNRSFYGLFTPVKQYQANILKVVQNNKSRHGFLALMNSLFASSLVYFVITHNLYFVLGFGLFTLILHMILVDTNDLQKIYRAAKKLDLDVDEYRLFDNSLFENLTREQVFYVYCIREELVAFIALNKQLDKVKLKEEIDREEYVLLTMIARQMERLGK